jgi:hypothetical protein
MREKGNKKKKEKREREKNGDDALFVVVFRSLSLSLHPSRPPSRERERVSNNL